MLVPVLLLLTSCDTRSTSAIYAPHEVGLTLAYENPQIASNLRKEQRLQVRVNRVTPLPAGGSLSVENVYTTLRGEITQTFLLEDGAVLQNSPEGPLLEDPLPKGFPDRVQNWTDHGLRFRVLGRAMAVGLEVALPDGSSNLGVWVEKAPANGNGALTRTFYLPNLGKVEVQEFQNGQWLTVYKLVGRGFTDAPYSKPS